MAWPFWPCWSSKARYDPANYGVTLPLWVLACAWLDFNLFLSTECSFTAIWRKKVMSQEFVSWSSFWNQWEPKVDLCLQNPVIKKLLFSIQFCHRDPYVIFLCLCQALSLIPESLVSKIHSMQVMMAELTLKGIASEGVRETGREK